MVLRCALLIAALAAPVSTAAALAAGDFTTMVAGIASSGRVVAAGIPLASGPWGTDYITVSHALSAGHSYSVMQNGQPAAVAVPVAACSTQTHGIDVLLLRAAVHQNRGVAAWGDPAELRAGDSLTMFVRQEFHPRPVPIKFLHLTLSEWNRNSTDTWSAQWHHVMVGEGLSQPGFSGSPWVRDGKVYGLLKGALRLSGQGKWVAVAETATRIRKCLTELHHEELIPND